MINSSFVFLIREELESLIAGGRIDRIQQPAKDVILLTVRNAGVNRKLLLSASSSMARVHITSLSFENPSEPPMFCMLLRKYILGARIDSVLQPGRDRIIELKLSNNDDIGRSFSGSLVLEMLPGKTNIILSGSDGVIIDCIFRRDWESDMYRRIFPGMIYRYPLQPEGYVQQIPEPFSSEKYDTLSAFLDDYYSCREQEEIFRRRSREVRLSLQSAEKRIRKKLALQREELARTESRETLRRRADLITANIYRIRPGESSVICEDFYEPSCPEFELQLDPLISPQQNAAKLYREYSKQKKAEEFLSELVNKAEDQLEYIGSALDALDRAASDGEIQAIKAEAVSSGIIRERNKSKKAKPVKVLPYLSFTTDDGYEILAGRNNLQNDQLTFKTASRFDYWFHVKGIHGSHVVLRCANTEPPEEIIHKAAEFAAQCSQAKGASVAVDYTRVKNVKKPSGSLPGKVIYTDYRTIVIK